MIGIKALLYSNVITLILLVGSIGVGGYMYHKNTKAIDQLVIKHSQELLVNQTELTNKLITIKQDDKTLLEEISKNQKALINANKEINKKSNDVKSNYDIDYSMCNNTKN